MLAAGYIALAVATVLGAEPAPVETETRPVEVKFEAPEGCSGPDAFFNTLRSRTGRIRRGNANEAHATIQVRLVRARGHIVGELGILDAHGGTDIRRVEGASCNDVVQALSLTAALALDPNAMLSAPATTTAQTNTMATAPAGEPSTAPITSSSTGQPDRSTPTPATKTTADLQPLDVPPSLEKATPAPSAVLASASLATTAPVPGLEIAVHTLGVGLLSGSLSPGFMLTTRRTLTGDGALRPTLGFAIAYARNDLLQSPADVQVSLASVAGTVCPLRWAAGIVTVQPCALLLAGRLSASGRRVLHSYQVEHLWLSAGAGVRTAVYLGRGLSLELDATLSVPLFKREFYATVPPNVVAKTPLLSPLVGVGLTYGL